VYNKECVYHVSTSKVLLRASGRDLKLGHNALIFLSMSLLTLLDDVLILVTNLITNRMLSPKPLNWINIITLVSPPRFCATPPNIYVAEGLLRDVNQDCTVKPIIDKKKVKVRVFI